MSTNQRLAMPILQPINTLHFYLLFRMLYRLIIRLLKRHHAKEHVCVGGITIGPRNSAVGRVKVMATYAWWHCTICDASQPLSSLFATFVSFWSPF